MGAKRSPALGRAIGRVSLRSAANPKATVAIILVATLAVGLGMTQLETDADLLKILPKDDPTTWAAQNASTGFRGFYDFVYIYYSIDPAACQQVSAERLPDPGPRPSGVPSGYFLAPQDCTNVTAEAYVRGMDELSAYFQDRMPENEYAIDLAMIVKSVNWTNSAYAAPDQGVLVPVLEGRPDDVGRPVDGGFAMPGTDPAGRYMYGGAWAGANAADDSINDVVSPEFKAGRTLLFFDTSDTTRVDVGRHVYDVVDEYQADLAACQNGGECGISWPVFDADAGLQVRGVSALDAHASDVTQRDISILAPFIIWAIVLTLYLAFRDARVIMVSAANLLVAFVWTAGLMGWMRIPFSALNMTIVPLILGVGIDYGIHMVSEYLEHRSDGQSNEKAFEQAGIRAGLAMAIATITTAVGLLLMAFSPSILMAQLGIVSSIALVVTFLFTITLVPALLSFTTRPSIGRTHKGSPAVLGLARAVSRHKVATIGVLAILTSVAWVGFQDLEPEPFGNPELNYPHGDRVRDDSEAISDLFFGGQTDTQSNFLVVEGDLRDPKAHEYLDALEVNLEQHPDIQGFSVTSLTRIVRAWLAIDGGTPDAAVNQFLLGNVPAEEINDAEYPATAEDIEATFDTIFESPFANFMTILLNEDGYDLGTVTYDTRQDLDFEDVQTVWAATWEVIHDTQREVYGVTQDEPGYAGPTTHPFGNNAFSYLFITKEQPWVNTIGLVSFALVVLMIAMLTRNVRATACTTVTMALTGLWWLGLLPFLGIGLSVGLMLPIVFIMAIGSDDAIHLIWNMENAPDRNKVYRFVGKAVLLTSVTTFIAFSIFQFQTDLLVRKTLLATSVAVVVMWLATMLVVPLFYPPRQDAARIRRHPRPSHREAEPHVEPEIVVPGQVIERRQDQIGRRG